MGKLINLRGSSVGVPWYRERKLIKVVEETDGSYQTRKRLVFYEQNGLSVLEEIVNQYCWLLILFLLMW